MQDAKRKVFPMIAVFGALMILGLLTMVAAGESVKISYSLWASDPQEINQIRERLDRFEAANPGVEVELLPTTEGGTSGHRDRMLTMIAAGTAPDLMMLSRSHQFDFWANDMLEPLTRYIDADPSIDWDDFLGHTQVTFAGEIWGIPEHGGGINFGYNIGLLERAGLADPIALYQREDWDLDAFLESARRLTQDSNGDGTPDVYGTNNFRGTQQITALVESFGGKMFSEDGRKVAFTSSEAVDALQWAIELERVYGVVGGSFADGTQAMNWICPRCVFRDVATERYEFEWNLVPPPSGPAGIKAPGGFNSLFVYSGSPHKKVAYDLAVFLTSKELQTELAQKGAIFTPVRRSTMMLPELRDQFSSVYLEGWLYGATDYLTPVPPQVPNAWTQIGTLSSNLEKVILEEASLGSVIESSAEVAQAQLDDAWKHLDQ